MNKLDLAKIAGLDTNKIDFTISQYTFDFYTKNGISTNLLVSSYEEKTYGQIKNLAEEFIYNSQNKIQLDFYKMMEFLEEYKKQLNKIDSLNKINSPLYLTLMELIELLNDFNVIKIIEEKPILCNEEL